MTIMTDKLKLIFLLAYSLSAGSCGSHDFSGGEKAPVPPAPPGPAATPMDSAPVPVPGQTQPPVVPVPGPTPETPAQPQPPAMPPTPVVPPQTITPPCNRAVAVALVMDMSWSMLEEGRLEQARSAANGFISALRPGDRIGLVGFDGMENLHFALSPDFSGARAALQTIRGATLGIGTVITAGLRGGGQLLDSVSDQTTQKVLVLLSDGVGVSLEDDDDDDDEEGTTVPAPAPTPAPGEEPRQMAAELKNQSVRIITVAYGNDPAGQQLMSDMTASPGDAIRPETDSALADAFATVAASLCR